jgi:hypothetical protein
MTDKEYAIVEKAWRNEGMRTVRDLLVWYNNLDVEPFLKALDKQCDIYARKNIDMLKEALSLLGLSTLWMFESIDHPSNLREAYDRFEDDDGGNFWTRLNKAVVATRKVQLIDRRNDDLYELYKKNTVGSPSLVFHRYHQKNVTKIREVELGEEARYCRRVLGVDANALYLYCVMGDMPVGLARRRFEEDDFALNEKRNFQGKLAQGWLAWREFRSGQTIETASNVGERRLGRHNLPVDGFCERTNTVYQFHGCYWHGHACSNETNKTIRKRTADERREDTLNKENYFRTFGYRVRTIWQCQWR